jgi:type I restriction enzyme M protein
VHLEHCAPNSDCLVLIPRKAADASPARLLLAASAVRLERWRYNYGRKITPQRLAGIKLAHFSEVERFTTKLFEKFKRVIEASLDPYRDYAEVAQLRGWSHGAN